MTRPYVNLKSKNIIDEMLQVLNNNLERFIKLEGVIGVTLNGGLSRGYADDLSEIDLVIYLDKDHYEKWNRGKSPIALGIVKQDGYLYDIKLAEYEKEKEKQWDSVSLWDLSYAKILYDPSGKIKELMDDKLTAPKTAQAEGLMFGAWWYFKLAGDIWIKRGDILQGHFIMNKAVIPLIEALFIANGEYIPHEKWIIHMSRSLKWKPESWEDKLACCLSAGDLTVESLVNRQRTIEGIWNEIDQYLINSEDRELNLNFSQKGCYEQVKYLLDKGRVTVETWEARYGLSALNYEPLYSFTNINDGWVIADKEKLRAIKPENMYYWMFDIIKHVSEEIDKE